MRARQRDVVSRANLQFVRQDFPDEQRLDSIGIRREICRTRNDFAERFIRPAFHLWINAF